jgi:hypothetical protein
VANVASSAKSNLLALIVAMLNELSFLVRTLTSSRYHFILYTCADIAFVGEILYI